MNIPNLLTVIRFLLAPIFLYTFYNSEYGKFILPFSIFIFAGITDILDGYIARKFNIITKFGTLLDPLADKVMQISVLIALTHKKIIPLWIIFVIITKELFLIIGSALLYKRNCIVQANSYGKLATVLFYISILITIFINNYVGKYLLILVVIFMIYSTINYTLEYYKTKNIKFRRVN